MEIVFEKGLIGLEQYKKYDLKELEGNPVFNILESMDNKDNNFFPSFMYYMKDYYQIIKADGSGYIKIDRIINNISMTKTKIM